MKKLQLKVKETFIKNFGRTPLRQRLEDIFGEAIELHRYTDLVNLKEELGDLMSSCMQLANECDWKVEDLVKATLDKVELRQKQYMSLGRKIKVAILGGAFDPITKGHIEVAKFVLDTSKVFDEVWIMPCYKHMYGKEMESVEHRLEMCRLASKVDGRIKVFDYEIRNEFAGQTYHLVKRLLDEDFAKHEYDFSLIIGQDNANTFNQWVEYEDLERMMRFVVVPRTGVKVDSEVTWYFNEPHIYLNAIIPLMEVSSTIIRNALKESSNVKWLNIKEKIDERVYNYINVKRLYK